MSIVSNSPRTRHQVSQLKAKQARDAAAKPVTVKTVNRVFGEGVFPVSPATPVAPIVKTVVMEDDGTLTPTASSMFRQNSNVTQADRREAAAMFAEIARKQDNALALAESREQEARDDVMEDIRLNNLAMADRELMEARRFESYGW